MIYALFLLQTAQRCLKRKLLKLQLMYVFPSFAVYAFNYCSCSCFLLMNAHLKQPVVHLLQLPASVLDLYYGIALSPGMLSMAVVRHLPPVDAIVSLP